MSPTNRRRKSITEKQAIIEKYFTSGLTQRVFCQQEGLTYSTFQLWLKKHRQTNVAVEPTTVQSSECFIPLVFDSPQADEITPHVVIEYPNGVVVRICQTLLPQVLPHLIQSYGG